MTAQLTATIETSSWSAMTPSTGTTAVCSTATVRTTTLSPITSTSGRFTVVGDGGATEAPDCPVPASCTSTPIVS